MIEKYGVDGSDEVELLAIKIAGDKGVNANARKEALDDIKLKGNNSDGYRGDGLSDSE